MNPRRCVIEESGKPIGWACQCGLFYSDKHFGGAPDAAQGATEACCVPPKRYVCPECGADAIILGKLCPACEGARRDREIYEKATKIPWEQHDGDMLSDGEKYGSDWDEFDNPDWLFATTEAKLKIDAVEFIQRELEDQEWFEEAIGQVSEANLQELQVFLDEWIAKAVPKASFTDYSRIVLRPKEDRG